MPLDQTPATEALMAPSGIGVGRPSFTHSLTAGATSTPPIPTLNAQQFGPAPNWSASSGPQVESALLPRPTNPAP